MRKTLKKAMAGLCAAAMVMTSFAVAPMEVKATVYNPVKTNTTGTTTPWYDVNGIPTKVTVQNGGAGSSNSVFQVGADLSGASTNDVSALFDGDNSTRLIFAKAKDSTDYFQLEFVGPITLRKAAFRFINYDCAFRGAKIQYQTTDNTSWTDLTTTTEGTASTSVKEAYSYVAETELEHVTKIRLKDTANASMWKVYEEITIDGTLENEIKVEAGQEYPLCYMSYSATSSNPVASNGAEGPISYAFDGNNATWWHSDYTNTVVTLDKVGVKMEFKEPTVISKISYLPRTANNQEGGNVIGNGAITKYDVFGTTAAGERIQLVDDGTWDYAVGEPAYTKYAEFAPIELASVELYAVESVGNDYTNKYANAAEIRAIVGETALTVTAKDGITGDAIDVEVPEGKYYNTLAVGDRVTVQALEKEDYTFNGWIDADSKNIVSQANYYTFTVTKNVNLEAVYSENTKELVTFKTGKRFSEKILAKNAITDGEVTVPDAPSFAGYNFDGWYTGTATVNADENGKAAATAAATWEASYSVIPENEYYQLMVPKDSKVTTGYEGEPTLNGSHKTYSYEKDAIVSVTAVADTENTVFAGWYADEGMTKLVSTSQTYWLCMTNSRTLYAKWDSNPIDAKPVVYTHMAERKTLSEDKQQVALGITWSVPEGYEVVGAGIIRAYSDTELTAVQLTLESDNVTVNASNSLTLNGSYTYTFNIGSGGTKFDQTVYAVGYVVYEHEDTTHVVYTEDVTALAKPTAE